jgi:hypothetical protein
VSAKGHYGTHEPRCLGYAQYRLIGGLSVTGIQHVALAASRGGTEPVGLSGGAGQSPRLINGNPNARLREAALPYGNR